MKYRMLGVFMVILILQVVMPEPVSAASGGSYDTEIQVDVLIMYDAMALTVYQYDLEQMHSDVIQGLSLYEDCSPSLRFYTSLDWMIFDIDGPTDIDDLDADGKIEMWEINWAWCDDIGWPLQSSYTENPWNTDGQMQHRGMVAPPEFSGVHDDRFDYLVMFTDFWAWTDEGWKQGNAGRHLGSNAILINLWPQPFVTIYSGWSISPFLMGTWSIIAHEVGHTFGLEDNSDNDVMNLNNQVLGINADRLSPENQERVRFWQHQHDEWFWDNSYSVLQNQFAVYTTKAGMTVNSGPVKNQFVTPRVKVGYYVGTDKIGEKGFHFMGLTTGTIQADSGGYISGYGVFRQFDTLADPVPNRRLTMYVYTTSMVKVCQFNILVYGDGLNWVFKAFSIVGLQPYGQYYIGIGRWDGANAQFKCEWAWLTFK